MKKRIELAALLFLCTSCIDTGQNYATVPLFAAGSDVSSPLMTSNNTPINIDRADLAFGPLYLCAGTTAGELCDTARFEWLDTATIDTTLTETVKLGELSGVTGPVRSWMYDLGISSQLTRTEPYVLDAAEQLGGFSFVLEARASVEGIEIAVVANIAIQQTEDTELGVPVIRKSTSESFFRDVSDDEAGLIITFDPSTWIKKLDLERHVTFETCTSSSAAVICDGLIERICDGQTEMSNRNCSDFGQVCLAGTGCAETLNISSTGEDFRKIRNALLSGPRPSFIWNDPP